jgi:hypothetical protein
MSVILHITLNTMPMELKVRHLYLALNFSGSGRMKSGKVLSAAAE